MVSRRIGLVSFGIVAALALALGLSAAANAPAAETKFGVFRM